MVKQRRHFTPEDKVKALRRHLVEKAPISDLCEELGIQPTQFYRWQQALFENATAALERPAGRPKTDPSAQGIAALAANLARKEVLLGELMEEHVALKKKLGGS
jgi:transposase-like protein